jgi:hypothetical protein
MTGATFDDVDTYGNLKELYSEDLRYQEDVLSSLYNFIRHADQGEIEFDGKNFNQGVTFQINESYAALNDTERLPDPDFPKGVFAQYRVKLMYSQIEATTFAATRGHAGGRVNGQYMDDYIKGTLLSFMSNLDSDSYANGRGYRATIATATAAATSFTVDFSTRLRPGMKLDWYNSALTVKRGSIKIALRGIDRQNRTVYVDTTFGSMAVPAAAAADDVLVVYGALAPGEPTDGRYMAGLDRICDSSVSLGGLSPSDYAAWLPTNINAAGANPNQELLQQHWDNINIISGMYPDRFVFNPAWKRGYLSGFLSQRQFTSNTYDTGASSLTFSPVQMGKNAKQSRPVKFEMLEDKNCAPESTYIWNYSAFCIGTDYSDVPHLADEDGSEFRMRLGYDSMQGFYRFWANTVTKQRNAIGKVSGWAVSAGVI